MYELQERRSQLRRTEAQVIRVIRTIQQVERQVKMIEERNPEDIDKALRDYADQLINMGATAARHLTRPAEALADHLEAKEAPDLRVSAAMNGVPSDSGITIHGTYAPVQIALSAPLQSFLGIWAEQSQAYSHLRLVHSEGVSRSDDAHPVHLRSIPTGAELS